MTGVISGLEHLTPQLSEKLTDVRNHQLRLFPKRKMARALHLGVVNEIEISCHHVLGRIEERHLTGGRGEARRHHYFAAAERFVI
jgi:hypothetical protein